MSNDGHGDDPSLNDDQALTAWFEAICLPAMNDDRAVCLKLLEQLVGDKPVGEPNKFARLAALWSFFAYVAIGRHLAAEDTASTDVRLFGYVAMTAFALVYPANSAHLPGVSAMLAVAGDGQEPSQELLDLLYVTAHRPDLSDEDRDALSRAVIAMGSQVGIDDIPNLSNNVEIYGALARIRSELLERIMRPPDERDGDAS